jgi:mutator protein MutT
MPLPTIQTAGGLLIDSQGKVLLGLRAPWKRVAASRWDTIGGHLEPGESPEAALVRELQEELGIRATTYRLIASLPEPRPDLYEHSVHHIFAVTSWTGGTPSNRSDEHTEVRWFAIDEVLALTNITDFDFGHLYALATSG